MNFDWTFIVDFLYIRKMLTNVIRALFKHLKVLFIHNAIVNKYYVKLIMIDTDD